MISRTLGLKQGEWRSVANPADFENPLNYIYEDHLHEREVCAQLDALALAQASDPNVVAAVLRFLVGDLPLHLADEEEDLFPLLRRRCEPEDEMDKVIARLTSDHRHSDEDTPQIIADLEILARQAHAMSDEMRTRFTSYAAHARRHLILENAIILPFARLRLTATDLRTLGLRMMQRRDLDQGHGDTQCSTT